MAVVNIREVYPGVSLGLWQMDESPEQLFDLYPHLLPYRSSLDDKYKNDGRKLEFLAIRALMYGGKMPRNFLLNSKKAKRLLRFVRDKEISC